MLIGVSLSWKIKPAAEIVTTSLKIPAIESVTTDVRCRRANSDAVMQNAMAPGNSNNNGPSIGPLAATSILMPSARAGNPSTGMAIRSSDANIIGAR